MVNFAMFIIPPFMEPLKLNPPFIDFCFKMGGQISAFIKEQIKINVNIKNRFAGLHVLV